MEPPFFGLAGAGAGLGLAQPPAETRAAHPWPTTQPRAGLWQPTCRPCPMASSSPSLPSPRSASPRPWQAWRAGQPSGHQGLAPRLALGLAVSPARARRSAEARVAAEEAPTPPCRCPSQGPRCRGRAPPEPGTPTWAGRSKPWEEIPEPPVRTAASRRLARRPSRRRRHLGRTLRWFLRPSNECR